VAIHNTNPATQAELNKIRQLHVECKGRNEISRITSHSFRTISCTPRRWTSPSIEP
jgi:hypothetical protein